MVETGVISEGDMKILSVTTEQAAALLELTEPQLLQWAQGGGLHYKGKPIITPPPKVNGKKGVKRQFNYSDVLRAQKELSSERSWRDLSWLKRESSKA